MKIILPLSVILPRKQVIERLPPEDERLYNEYIKMRSNLIETYIKKGLHLSCRQFMEEEYLFKNYMEKRFTKE